jgi:hypothetical protein
MYPAANTRATHNSQIFQFNWENFLEILPWGRHTRVWSRIVVILRIGSGKTMAGVVSNQRMLFACAMSVAFLGLASSLPASIIAPKSAILSGNVQDFMVESLSSTKSTSMAPTPKVASQEAPNFDPASPNNLRQLAAASLIFGGSSSNSTSSNSGGSNAPDATSLCLLSTASIPDLDQAGWVSADSRLALPNPPGNDLLRPPQTSCNS